MNKKVFTTTVLLVAIIFSIKAQKTNTTSIDSLIYKKREFNKTAKKGFRIQIYNGDEKIAYKRTIDFQKQFPNIKVIRTYKEPEWKVQTEIYRTRIKADRVLNLIKEKYPDARVL